VVREKRIIQITPIATKIPISKRRATPAIAEVTNRSVRLITQQKLPVTGILGLMRRHLNHVTLVTEVLVRLTYPCPNRLRNSPHREAIRGMIMRELNNTREIEICQLDQVSGGVSLTYAKPEIVYTPQKSNGRANFRGGDPDEGGQFHFQARLI
jgi:hypothetical protein